MAQLEETATINPAPLQKAVVGVKESIYYRPIGGQATEIVRHQEGSFALVLNTEEQPYRRRMVVKEEWTPVSLGWTIEDGQTPSFICLINEEGQFLQAIPSPEERKKALGLIIEIGLRLGDTSVVTPFSRLRPVQSCRFEPIICGHTLVARCRTGQARMTVVAVPGANHE